MYLWLVVALGIRFVLFYFIRALIPLRLPAAP